MSENKRLSTSIRENIWHTVSSTAMVTINHQQEVAYLL